MRREELLYICQSCVLKCLLERQDEEIKALSDGDKTWADTLKQKIETLREVQDELCMLEGDYAMGHTTAWAVLTPYEAKTKKLNLEHVRLFAEKEDAARWAKQQQPFDGVGNKTWLIKELEVQTGGFYDQTKENRFL